MALRGMNGFYIRGYSGAPFILRATYPFESFFPPGTGVLASIALSKVNNVFIPPNPLPPAAAVAWIDSWRVYQPDGSVSDIIHTDDPNRNFVGEPSCASITFAIYVEQCETIAQVTLYEFHA